MTPADLVDFHVDWHLRERDRRNDVWLENNAPRCVHGHVLNSRNLYISPVGNRACRNCRRNSHLRERALEPPMPRVTATPIHNRIRWLCRKFTHKEIAHRYGIQLRQLERVLAANTLRLDAADYMVTRLQMEPVSVLWPDVGAPA